MRHGTASLRSAVVSSHACMYIWQVFLLLLAVRVWVTDMGEGGGLWGDGFNLESFIGWFWSRIVNRFFVVLVSNR